MMLICGICIGCLATALGKASELVDLDLPRPTGVFG